MPTPWRAAISTRTVKRTSPLPNNNNTVSVFLGDGRGGFTNSPGSPFFVAGFPYSIAAGDFNGDGNPDLVVASSQSGTVTVLLGDGSGGFTVGSPSNAGPNPYSNRSGRLRR